MLLVGFQILELKVYKRVVVVRYSSKLICLTATCFQHFWLNSTNEKLKKEG